MASIGPGLDLDRARSGSAMIDGPFHGPSRCLFQHKGQGRGSWAFRQAKARFPSFSSSRARSPCSKINRIRSVISSRSITSLPDSVVKVDCIMTTSHALIQIQIESTHNQLRCSCHPCSIFPLVLLFDLSSVVLFVAILSYLALTTPYLPCAFFRRALTATCSRAICTLTIRRLRM